MIEKAQPEKQTEPPRVVLTVEASREDVKNLRRALAWAERRSGLAEQRIEQRRAEAEGEGKQDLQAEIEARVRMLRATKSFAYYDGIRSTLSRVLGRWKTDQPGLFDDKDDKEEGHGDTERPAGGEGASGGEEGVVSGGRGLPPEGQEPGQDEPERPAELAGDGA